MVVDGAENCVYDIFATPDEDFALIFPEGTDIAFIEDIERREDAERVSEALRRTWSNRIAKRKAGGIRGIVFYQLCQAQVLPNPAGAEAVNPDGSALR